MYSFSYFNKYILYKKRRDICQFEITQAGDNTSELRHELRQLENSMSEIKSVIDDYAPNRNDENNFADERLFLRCRYIDGLTMEKTAEMMSISRNTVYRIKKKIEVQLIRRLS